MHQEKYSLTWQTYSDHLKSMMKELMMNEDFSDVTLVTEDKRQIKANINILSACSPVFKNLLKKEKNSNQIMYLRGIQFTEMEAIMQFIYLGEATFSAERMDELTAVAKSLEINELYNAVSEINITLDDEPLLSDSEIPTGKMEGQTVKKDILEFGEIPTVKMEVQSFEMDLLELSKEQTVISDHITKQDLQDREGCVVGVKRKYECKQCHKILSKGALHNHKKIVHEGVKYDCDQCNYKATQKSDLRKHIQSKHIGMKYACGQCDYRATTQSNLTAHIHSKHEGVKYACGQCDFRATYRVNLTAHIKKKH